MCSMFIKRRVSAKIRGRTYHQNETNNETRIVRLAPGVCGRVPIPNARLNRRPYSSENPRMVQLTPKGASTARRDPLSACHPRRSLQQCHRFSSVTGPRTLETSTFVCPSSPQMPPSQRGFSIHPCLPYPCVTSNASMAAPLDPCVSLPLCPLSLFLTSNTSFTTLPIYPCLVNLCPLSPVSPHTPPWRRSPLFPARSTPASGPRTPWRGTGTPPGGEAGRTRGRPRAACLPPLDPAREPAQPERERDHKSSCSCTS